ncbi:hypothetical protein E2C01_007955 [Portunus trituberculatus]|uniref:Uncharacterized protein n=1 Tax=Portunus trituberculatus TaxID=210409 RepID=A0A5B7D1T3_PORTR|nr:hypothetical protein [Portunus trituberculatus]
MIIVTTIIKLHEEEEEDEEKEEEEGDVSENNRGRSCVFITGIVLPRRHLHIYASVASEVLVYMGKEMTEEVSRACRSLPPLLHRLANVTLAQLCIFRIINSRITLRCSLT